MKKIGLIITVLILQITAVSSQTNKLEVANKFFEAYEQLNFDKMYSLWDDSIIFKDFIASESHDIPDKVIGKKAYINMMGQTFSKKPNYIDLNILDQFESGDYVITHLTFESSIERKGKVIISNGEMFTVLKIENHKITEHLDFADYDKWDRQSKSVLEGKHQIEYSKVGNLKTAKDYMVAYAQGDVKTMASYWSNDIDFKDLTAKNVFKANDYEQSGKINVEAFWQNVLVESKPKHVDVKIHGLFFSSNYVMLNTRFSMILPVAWTGGVDGVYISIPIKTILEIKKGKIFKHYDFADYNLYQSQINLQKQ